MPDDGGDGILEDRSRDYKRDDNGRFAYDGGRKEKKRTTKYAPSKQANKSKIKVSPKKFCILRGIFNTQYSNLKAGDTRTINDGKYIYIATADGSGSITINDKFAIQTKKRSSNHE